jgi:hypothetical protein
MQLREASSVEYILQKTAAFLSKKNFLKLTIQVDSPGFIGPKNGLVLLKSYGKLFTFS